MIHAESPSIERGLPSTRAVPLRRASIAVLAYEQIMPKPSGAAALFIHVVEAVRNGCKFTLIPDEQQPAIFISGTAAEMAARTEYRGAACESGTRVLIGELVAQIDLADVREMRHRSP